MLIKKEYTMKKCSYCKKEKTLAEFGRLSSSKDGYRRECRECRKRYWKKAPEEIEKWKEWRKDYMRQLGINSRGRIVSEETKNKKRRKDKLHWETHDYDLAAKKRTHYNYQRKGFSAGLEKFVELVTSKCFYCGCDPDSITTVCRYTKYGTGCFKHLGLDRVDNIKGYELENIVPCCWRCNNAKWTYSVEEFKSWIESVYKNFILPS